MASFPKIKPYNYSLQALNMRSKFPQFKAVRKKNGYDFIGILKPRDTEYQVHINYGEFAHPKVFVLSPELKSRKHMYQDGSLCIYKRSELKWRKDLLVSKYIVPLTAMWLYYYEIFILTDEWLGPEAPHNDEPSDIKIDDNPTLP
ncbi:MAG: hypothetical protein HY959_03870 [Ignavibacteriae bacterium]|nr:hypothetical protein [Ignavibacteriota bacterium]